MNEQVRTKMLTDYSQLEFRGRSTCVKYKYDYNSVTVNLYFDAFDPHSYSLTMILNTERLFYFTTLNIMNTRIRKEYLPELPPAFLHKILVDNELDEFYKHMEEKILSMTPTPISYKKDNTFKRTIELNRDVDLPFLWHLRKMRMTDDTLEKLHERANISRKTLYDIQKRGFTLVRTDDIDKRKSLKLILGEYGITLS
ncbi:MAG: hypothetical protein IJX86_13010 [Lachnospiraceae bacterium]|nr:hypothetical protein [Lachnospiraceae bacterium]